MIPVQVDPSWYEIYWLTPRPPRRRRWRHLRTLWRLAGRRTNAAAPRRQPAGRRHRSVIELIGLWSRDVTERRALARMSDRILRDVGLTRRQALCKADKPFWRG
jgi:uncharacterized protein YjiS (DUF1127 family)